MLGLKVIDVNENGQGSNITTVFRDFDKHMRHKNTPVEHIMRIITVLQKMQNPGSPSGPPMVDGWVVRLSSGWSVNQ